MKESIEVSTAAASFLVNDFINHLVVAFHEVLFTGDALHSFAVFRHHPQGVFVLRYPFFKMLDFKLLFFQLAMKVDLCPKIELVKEKNDQQEHYGCDHVAVVQFSYDAPESHGWLFFEMQNYAI